MRLALFEHPGLERQGLRVLLQISSFAEVAAASAFRAGQFATAAFLFGPEEGFALLEETPGIEGALITETGDLLPTTGMKFLSDLPGCAWAANSYF
jgi:hypothetical protein